MVKNKVGLPMEIEVLKYRKVLRDKAVSESTVEDFERPTTELDLFCNFSDCLEHLEKLGFKNIPVTDTL